jgi:undecaprenyl-diphosphatase
LARKIASRATSESVEGESALMSSPLEDVDEDEPDRDGRRAPDTGTNPYASRVDGSAIERFDQMVEDFFDHLRGRPLADRVLYGLTDLADFGVLWHLLGVSQGLNRADGFERAARTSAALGVESLLVNVGIKSLVRRHRPVPDFERPHRLRIPRTSSFPSGHATSAFVAAALLSDGSRAKPAYYALATLVAWSRVHVRIHHASDVIAGIAIGVGLGALAKRVWPIGLS